ncbi:hypothetical protein TNCV_3988631 [Trichonephila clavipes]|nr:hypothetical protein TNCV_3988631 [Trichonephila clavipes]
MVADANQRDSTQSPKVRRVNCLYSQAQPSCADICKLCRKPGGWISDISLKLWVTLRKEKWREKITADSAKVPRQQKVSKTLKNWRRGVSGSILTWRFLTVRLKGSQQATHEDRHHTRARQQIGRREEARSVGSSQSDR